MRKVLVTALVVLVAIVGVGIGFGRTAAGMYSLSFLAEPAAVDTLAEPTYADESVSVQVAFTEGKYVVGAAALSPDVLVLLQDGDLKSYITAGPKPVYSFTEVTAERLSHVRVLVYDTAGWTLNRKPVKALRVDGVKEPMKPATVAAFKQSLQ